MYHVKMDLICIICAVLLPMNMLSQAPRKKKKVSQTVWTNPQAD